MTKATRVGIVDYGIGNTRSISNMLQYSGISNLIGKSTKELECCQSLILPGVGAFGSVMGALEEKGFTSFIRDWALSGKELVGICAGMQLLGDGSEESDRKGLGILPVFFKRFPNQDESGQKLQVPHMGWNYVSYDKSDQTLCHMLPDSRFYFVHSYCAVNVPPEMVMMQANYGIDFIAAFRNGNVMGFQFHPEKSHKFGMALLQSIFKQDCKNND